MTYKEYKNESYNLYTIKTDKFKTCHMEIIFYDYFKKEDITRHNFLMDMLAHSSKDYPKRKNVTIKLEDLYNASFYGVSSRVGKIKCINFIYNFIDPKYTDKTYLKEVIKFPFDMLFNPNITNDEFDLRSFNIIKSRIQADIDSIKESPTRYAIKRCFKFMDENHPASAQLVGYQEDLDKITPSNLVKTYKEFIKQYKCDIYLVGNLDMDKINYMINEYFRNNYIKNKDFDVYLPPIDIKGTKTLTEKDNFKQSTLVCVLKTDKLTEFEKNYVMNVFNFIFGSGSLNSYLSKNIREKNSLCYSVNSGYQKYDNFLLVTLGINYKNKDKCVKLIKESLKEIQTKLTVDEVNNAIKTIVGSAKVALDSLSSLTDNYFFHNLVNIPLLEEKIEHFSDVTIDDVINVSKKVSIKVVYLMAGVDNEGN